MDYLKIDDDIFSAEFSKKMVDKDWDNRETKTITLSGLSQNAVNSMLKDDVKWYIYDFNKSTVPVLDENGQQLFDENNQPIMTEIDESKEYDNSAFCVRGPMTIYPDGRISVKMGKPTELEEAYELLYGGI